eukprot:m.46740 g.46740  ORF g.46740 m.46740 type:complete len:152 (-) comp47448_c0_seq7:167-622(-)
MLMPSTPAPRIFFLDSLVVTGGIDGNINVWNYSTGKTLRLLPHKHASVVVQLASTELRRVFVSCGFSASVVLWSSETFQMLWRFQLQREDIHSTSISPDAEEILLCSLSQAHALKLEDGSNLRLLCRLSDAQICVCCYKPLQRRLSHIKMA